MPKKNITKTASAQYGTLYVVATPIGNLEDITLRAIRILKEVDLIAAEDTRHTRKLLTHYGISTSTFSYYKEKEQQRSAVLIQKLLEGKNIALVSDAGTPGISDPGSILVQLAVTSRIRVEPIPGPSALSAALSIAGQADNSFIFLGFAPSRKKQRRDLLKTLSRESRSLVFFEAPHRLQAFLQDCYEVLGDRHIFWCRELTKIHEELTRTSLSIVISEISNKKIKGESVIILGGKPSSPAPSQKEIEQLLLQHKLAGKLSLKDAVKTITAESKLSRSSVYALALKIWNE